MLSFGKKVSYRPLLISLLVALLPGLAFTEVLNLGAGIAIGFGFFLVIFLFYYYPNIPLEFSYWEVDQNAIKYVDTDDKKNRLLSMLLPPSNHLTTIKKEDIRDVALSGNIHKDFNAPMAIPYTASLGIFYGGIAMVHNPDYVQITLKNGNKINLSVRRDYTYSRQETIKKLNHFFDDLTDYQIQIDLPRTSL